MAGKERQADGWLGNWLDSHLWSEKKGETRKKEIVGRNMKVTFTRKRGLDERVRLQGEQGKQGGQGFNRKGATSAV